MGITGLLPFLEKATTEVHLSDFSGCTVVIDSYCWLHRGAYGFTEELALGKPNLNGFVQYCMKFIKMLKAFRIRPIMVFDGKNLPAKELTEVKRREARQKAKQRGLELLNLGKHNEAKNFLRQSINITPEMASAVIKECHKINVDCIVAPYESDSQLAFFNMYGHADFVITEDSDLVLFGCSKVMYKLDLNGKGKMVDASKICEAMKLRPDKYSFDKFRYMCILSGCDYIQSLQGIGLKKALKFISLLSDLNPESFLVKLPRYLNMKNLEITAEYIENFMIADATFKHQIVFDPFKGILVPLQDPQVCGTNPKYCRNAGEIFDNEIAYQVALGNLNPNNLKVLDTWEPDKVPSTTTIWSRSYKKSVAKSESRKKFINLFKKKEIAEIEINPEEEERRKADEDAKLLSEMMFYTKNSNASNTKTERIEEEDLSSLSPVVSKNPFIIRKETLEKDNVVIRNLKKELENSPPKVILSKLNKICENRLDKNKVVLSRYFSSASIISNDSKKNVKEIEENLLKMNVDCVTVPVSLSSCDETNAAKLTQTKHLPVTTALNSLENVAEEIVVDDYSNEKPIESEDTTKKRKLNSCKSVGLSRKKPKHIQKTLSFFFNVQKS